MAVDLFGGPHLVWADVATQLAPYVARRERHPRTTPERARRAAFAAVCFAAVRRYQAGWPVDTGRSKRGLSYRLHSDGLAMTLTDRWPYAPYVEALWHPWSRQPALDLAARLGRDGGPPGSRILERDLPDVYRPLSNIEQAPAPAGPSAPTPVAQVATARQLADQVLDQPVTATTARQAKPRGRRRLLALAASSGVRPSVIVALTQWTGWFGAGEAARWLRRSGNSLTTVGVRAVLGRLVNAGILTVHPAGDRWRTVR